MNNEVLFKHSFTWSSGYIDSKNFQCGYCGKSVNSSEGMETEFLQQYLYEPIIKEGVDQDKVIGVYICPNCNKPTFIDEIINKIQSFT